MGNFHLANWSPWFLMEDKLVKVKPRPTLSNRMLNNLRCFIHATVI